EQALVLKRETGNRRSGSITLGYLALLHAEQGRMKEARALYAEALTISRELGDRHQEGVLLGRLAAPECWELGELPVAEPDSQKAFALLMEVKDKLELGVLLCIEGHLSLWRGESAGPLYDQAATLMRETGAGGESELGKKLRILARAQAAFTAG